MPRAQTYESTLLAPLTRSGIAFDPVWIRLASHAYASSDQAHIADVYQRIDTAGALDGLLLSGAPVEELAFDEVTYWPELQAILRAARNQACPTLGVCWGGLALAQLLGVEKVRFATKLFGVFPLRVLDRAHVLLRGTPDVFPCPQSRHSGITDDAIERAVADGRLRALAHSPEAGYAIVESSDGLYQMHLGHPEYEAERLVWEYRRDAARGRSDVQAPHDLSLTQPIDVWRAPGDAFFAQWLKHICSRPTRADRAT
jgi:homoserine O-succinyltransferase